MKKGILLFVMVLSLGLSGCMETFGPTGSKQQVGTGAGAVLGGLAGSQMGKGSGRLWATGAGVLVGALLGSEIGSSLDKADLAYAKQANTRAYTAPIGETITWSNPESGNSGAVTPVREGYTETTGAYCREYQQEIFVGGRSESAYGVACRQPDGSWKIIK